MDNIKAPFFGGDPKNALFKWTTPLDASNFREFFESQLYIPVTLDVTESEYNALLPEEQNAKKFVRFFTPGAFAEPTKGNLYLKNNANVSCIKLVCIDIDPEKVKNPETGDWEETGVYPAAPIVDNPKILHSVLDGLNFAAYTTLNHKTGRPRIRIIIECSGFHPDLYPKAVEVFGSRLGLAYVTSESKVISQAMFRPTVFKDTDLTVNHPVFACNVKGQALTPEMFAGVTESTTGTPTPQKTTGGGFLDGLEFLRPKSEGVLLEDVAFALESISPNVDMMTWIKIAMSLRHQFEDQDDAAFDVFNEWSAAGNTYEGEEKARYRWDHTESKTLSRIPVTIKTFFKIAKDSGFKSKDLEARYFEQLVTWIKSQESLGELIEEGVTRIVTTPLISPVLEDSLLTVIKDAAKKNFGHTVNLASLKKRLRKIRADIQDKEKEQRDGEAETPPWAMGLIFVISTKKIYRFATTESMDRDAFDSAYEEKLLPTDKELEMKGEPVTRQGRATATIQPQKYVLNELKIPKVYDDIYDPANAEEHIITKQKVRYVNTYRKTHPKPCPETSEAQGQAFFNHIKLLIKEPAYQQAFMDFLAFMVQSPGVKIRYAILIQSVHGNGKGLIATCARGILGRGHVKSVDTKAVFSGYNDWAYGAQLTVLNEIRIAGHSRHDAMNALKEPIADKEVSITEKYRSHREVENVTNYLIFTNHQDALALERTERRYFVIRSPLQTEAHVNKLNESGALDPMKALVDADEFGGLRHFFENWEISEDFNPNGPPPKTKYFYEMVENSSSEAQSLVSEIITDGDNPFAQEDLISSGRLLESVNLGMAKKTNAKHMGTILTQMGYFCAGRYRVNTERHTLWVEYNSPIVDLDLGAIIEARVANCGEELL